MDDDYIEVTHVLDKNGKCWLSLNGQGHIPCQIHPSVDDEPSFIDGNI